MSSTTNTATTIAPTTAPTIAPTDNPEDTTTGDTTYLQKNKQQKRTTKILHQISQFDRMIP
jgi:hypothetical protein